MKNLFIIRHAKSSWANMSQRDIERPLNKRGKRDAPFMSKLLKQTGVSPDLIVSSPANRAFTTASFFAEAFGISTKDIRKESQIYDAFPSDILDIVRELPDEANTILLFGHNPTFTSVANMFSESMISNMPTCSIVKIEADIKNWADFSAKNGVLTQFHYPKQYFK